MAVVLDSRRNRLFMSTGRGGTVAVIDLTARNRQAGHRGHGRDTALGHRVVAGRPLALHGQRSVERRERRRHLDAARASRRFRSEVRRGASSSAPLRRSKRRRHRVISSVYCASPQAFSGVGSPLPETASPVSRACSESRKIAPPSPGKTGILRERRGFDELVVAQPIRDPVDGARALIQIRQLVAVCCDAFVHVFDARLRRVIVDRAGRRATGGNRARRARLRQEPRGVGADGTGVAFSTVASR